VTPPTGIVAAEQIVRDRDQIDELTGTLRGSADPTTKTLQRRLE
jgi:hypothetical protein